MTFVDLPVLPSVAAMRPPSSLVVRYGHMRMMGEFAYDGDVRPGCGAKVVVRTRRGTELAEVVTTTCSNAGCAKSITRDKLLEYIENSGGADYPFSTEGRVMRIAGPDDYRRQSEVEAEKAQYVSTCKTLIREMDLPMKLVEVELLLGGELATFFFASEQRVDFRALVKHLASRFRTRIQMHQVGARDEARLVADYETCGQHCCCKQFLKVLKPVNMNSAKMQRATFDPNKISGRCGRLKCCLRYEESTYEEMKKQLPGIGMRVRVEDGIGKVIDAMILTQLVKVRLEGNDRIVAVANEEILERDVSEAKAPKPRVEERRDGEGRGGENRRRPPARGPRQEQEFEEFAARRANEEPGSPPEESVEMPKQPTVEDDAEAPLPKVEEAKESAPPPQPPQNPPRPPGVGMMGRRKRMRGNRGPGSVE